MKKKPKKCKYCNRKATKSEILTPSGAYEVIDVCPVHAIQDGKRKKKK